MHGCNRFAEYRNMYFGIYACDIKGRSEENYGFKTLFTLSLLPSNNDSGIFKRHHADINKKMQTKANLRDRETKTTKESLWNDQNQVQIATVSLQKEALRGARKI